MSSIIPFNYKSKQVRTIIKDGEPWFVVKDVCEILEINNPNMAAARLDDDEVSQAEVIDSLGRRQMTNVVNEPGLYNLILRSDKPEAKRFKRWIAHEVLPAIRKHGAYMTPETIEKVLSDPDTIIRLATELKKERQRRMELEPKAQGYDYLMNAQGTVTIGEAAKIIDIKGIGQNKFFKILVAEGIIYKKGNSYLPYSEYKEHFVVKQNPIPMGDMVVERSQLYLDMAGLDWLAKLLARRGYEVNYTQKKALVG
jgi:anti-repressor protein